MKPFGQVVTIAFTFLLPLPVLADDDKMSISGERLAISVADEVKADADKAKAIKDYQVLSRIQREIQGYIGGLNESANVEVVITSFRLRGGVSWFFGMSGDDVIDAKVTIRDKGKQTGHFVVNADNGRSGRTQPPTRRVVRLVQEFGQKFGAMLSLSQGKMPFFPGQMMIPGR
jgi:hypothetical protein